MKLWPIWRVPTFIGVASGVGLIAALVGDGVWDAVSWVTLGGAAAIGAWYAMRRHR